MTDAVQRVSYRFEAIRNGVKLCDLCAGTRGQIVCSANAELKRALSCTLYNIPGSVDLLSDRVRVTMVRSGCADEPLGTYMITTAPKSVSAAGVASYSVEGYDLTYLVYRTKVEARSAASFAAGSLYTDIIAQLLVHCGVVSSIITESPLTLSAIREDWEVGESYLTIINTLLAEISYNSLWFDAEGTAHCEPYISPVLRDAQRRYDAGHDSIVLREHTLEDDTFDAYNVFTVGVDNADMANPIYCQSVNDDPASRLSTVSRGRIAAPVVTLDSVTDATAAQAYCDNLKYQSMVSTETATIKTAPEAGHEVNDMISVNLPELSGKFEETGWTLPLDGVTMMTHTMRRAVYV